MGQFSVEKPVAPGSVLSGNQHSMSILRFRTASPAAFPFLLFECPRGENAAKNSFRENRA